MHDLESLWQSLLELSVSHILAEEDYNGLIEMLSASPVLDALFEDAPQGAKAVFVHRFGREIWNTTPLPGNRFRPRHRSPPSKGQRCPCGSGLKYKQCCLYAPRAPRLEPWQIWAIAWSMFEESERKAALASAVIPAEALPFIAREQLYSGHPGRARDLLKPLFEKSKKASEAVLSEAVEPLSEAYRDLGHHAKRKAFLEQIVDNSDGAVLAAAVGELSPILADTGHWDEAWRRHSQGMRAVPDDPMLALLEVTLLYAEQRGEEAVMRAEFWRRRLGDRLDPDHPACAAFERIAANPEAGILAMTGDDELMEVVEVIDHGLDRPEAAHRVVREEPFEDLAGFEQGIRRRLHGMGLSGEDLERAVAEALREYEQDSAAMADESTEDEDADNSAALQAPDAIAAIEERWRDIYPVTKPFASSFEPFGEADPWDPEIRAQWLEFLEQNPAAFDSLDILDDVATALYMHPATFEGSLHSTFAAVVRRGARLLDRSLSGHGEPLPELPWPTVDNRPALRLLVHHVYLLEAAGDQDEAVARMQQYMTLNPGDNHGFRCQLIAHYLERGDDESALTLSERFPDDMLLETSMGRVLALYRLGRADEAAAALEIVYKINTHVIEMLTQNRAKKPKIEEHGMRIGRRDQAWLYRNAMRPLWQQTPGAIDWLRERGRALRSGA